MNGTSVRTLAYISEFIVYSLMKITMKQRAFYDKNFSGYKNNGLVQGARYLYENLTDDA